MYINIFININNLNINNNNRNDINNIKVIR